MDLVVDAGGEDGARTRGATASRSSGSISGLSTDSTPQAVTILTSAAMNRWASITITWVRITPISAASWRSAKPSTA